jgi:hypothetical protein
MRSSKDNSSTVALLGMDRGATPSSLKNNAYSFALNANLEDGYNEGEYVITNEPSNIKCYDFKGWFVLKAYYDRVSERIYLFLLNEDSGCSEIGYIKADSDFDINEVEDVICNCKPYAVDKTPLEDVLQENRCVYTKIVSDCCTIGSLDIKNGCLNFKREFPIIDVEIRHSSIGDELYWNDGNNPDRYIKLYDIDSYMNIVEPCTGVVEKTCLQCDKLNVFPKYKLPYIKIESVDEGGTLRAGVYSIHVCYSDISGTTLSDYVGSNQVAIFDKNNVLIDQTQTDYVTEKSIRIIIEDLDPTFDFFKIVIKNINEIDRNQSYKIYGVYPSSTKEVVISSIPITLESSSEFVESNIVNEFDILAQRPYFLNSRILNQADDRLFLGKLKANRTLNLQPIVNLLGSFVFWSSGVAKEDLYSYGEATANYKGYMRLESYPLSIRFTGNNLKTALFPLIPRPSRPSEIAEKTGIERTSIDSNVITCGEFNRDKVWQFDDTSLVTKSYDISKVGNNIYNDGWDNTKISLLDCGVSSGSDTVESIVYCDSEEFVIYNGTVSNKPDSPFEQYIDLMSWINAGSPLTAINEDHELDDIINALTRVYDNCEYPNPLCNIIEVHPDKVYATSVVGESVGEKSLPYDKYPYIIPESIAGCNNVVKDEDGAIIHDEDMEGAVYNVNGGVSVTINKKKANTNTSCGLSSILSQEIMPSLLTPFWLTDYYASGDYNSILTTIPASKTDSEFKGFLHKNAVWFKQSFNGNKLVVFQIIKGICENNDDNTNNKIRVSIYKGCPTVSEVPLYSRIINDVTLNNVTSFFEIPYDDFNYGADDIYIAIDSPYKTYDNGVDKLTVLQPPCSCMSILNRVLKKKATKRYDEIHFVKRKSWTISCDYKKIIPSSCNVYGYEEGLFSYSETDYTYPCNDELYDSSHLIIDDEDKNKLTPSERSYFEKLYIDPISGGLSNNADFRNKNVRLYKFPSNNTSAFMSEVNNNNNPNNKNNANIFPIGFKIDNRVINMFLDVALKNGLITKDERADITGYDIFRGDRRANRTIISKGLLYDMNLYIDKSRDDGITLYPNYPLNHQGFWDMLNMGGMKASTNMFTFQSPDTNFNKPILPYELYIDGFQFGDSVNSFSDVKRHGTYVLLGRNAKSLAGVLAGLEFTFELAMYTAPVLTTAVSGSILTAAPATIVATSLLALQGVAQGIINIPKRIYEWTNTFEALGNPYNFAYYGVAEGLYNKFQKNYSVNNRLRGLEISHYLNSNRQYLTNEHNDTNLYINNYNRENAVFVYMKQSDKYNFISEYIGYDNSRLNINSEHTGRLSFLSKTASPYATLKRYLPSQYGGVNSVSWIPTNYKGDLSIDNSCDIIFGGDIFISRFSIKRKFPFFTSNAIDAPPNMPFKYSSYFNINTGIKFARGYLDFKTADDNDNFNLGNLAGSQSQYSLYDGSDFKTDITKFFINDKYKFLLFYYGFPYFLVESEYNCNFRHGGFDRKQQFYPRMGDFIDATQEVEVPISENERFWYNTIYSSQQNKVGYNLLPVNFNRETADKDDDFSYAVIISDQDTKNSSFHRSPWLNFRVNNIHFFNKSQGRLIDIDTIENELLWVRFTDGYEIDSPVDAYADKITTTTRVTGIGGILKKQASLFNDTVLGYAGTYHKASIKTEFGHFSVDSKRGKVFLLGLGGTKLDEISLPMQKWFKEQLPFKILKKYPEVNVDNTYNGLGLSMGWDDRTKRFFLTKLDYIPLNKDLLTNNGLLYDLTEKGQYHLINKYTNKGYAFIEFEDFNLIFTKDDEQLVVQAKFVDYFNEDYFKPAYFTVAYKPMFKNWVSYYSFHPNYYVSLNEHFKTGVNSYNNKHGMWSHYPLVGSYQVFYGELHPFTVETVVPSQGSLSTIEDVAFTLDVRRYYNLYDYASIYGEPFNKAYVYNDKNNSGLLNLKFTDGEDERDIDFPKYNNNSIDILIREEQGIYSFNYLFNHVSNYRSGLPIWNMDNVDVDKELNDVAMRYINDSIDRIRGSFFHIRLIQDKESMNKLTYRMSNSERNFY